MQQVFSISFSFHFSFPYLIILINFNFLKIIIWLESDDPMYVGYLYALGLFLAPFLQSIIQNHYFYQTFRTGMNVRAAVVSLLYRKSLKLTTSSRQKKTLVIY